MRTSTTTLAFKLITEAEKGRRKITRWQQLELVQQGRVFRDGELVADESAAQDRIPMGCPSTKLESIPSVALQILRRLALRWSGQS